MNGISDFLESQVKMRIENEDEVRGKGTTLNYSLPHLIARHSMPGNTCAKSSISSWCRETVENDGQLFSLCGFTRNFYFQDIYKEAEMADFRNAKKGKVPKLQPAPKALVSWTTFLSWQPDFLIGFCPLLMGGTTILSSP